MSECCPAALNIAGEHFQCDYPAGHGEMAHGNKDAQAIWQGDGRAEAALAAVEAALNSVSYDEIDAQWIKANDIRAAIGNNRAEMEDK